MRFWELLPSENLVQQVLFSSISFAGMEIKLFSDSSALRPHIWLSKLNSNLISTNSPAFNNLIPPLSREMPVPVRSDPAADERGQRPGVDRAGDRVHQHRGADHQGQSGAHQAGD